MSDALVIIPTFLRRPADLDVTVRTIESIRETEPTVKLLIVDDHSPADALWEALCTHQERFDFSVHRQEENGGFSRAVNVGLRQALKDGQDAVLLNADIECLTPDWVSAMQAQNDTQGRPAAVVGALLLYPMGLIQHAGIYFSFLTRSFDHRYRFGPGRLPEAQQPCLCPVTGAFQFIRHECLETVGLYDEDFRLGFEDVDWCLRVFDSGRECIYQPRVMAVHHESLFRGRADEKLAEWQDSSLRLLMSKHRTTNMSRWVPEFI